MIGYIRIAPSLPPEDEQIEAIGDVIVTYVDKGDKRDDFEQMIADIDRRDETIRIATASVFGAGRDLNKALKKLVGATVHVCDTGETVPITLDGTKMLSFAALAARLINGRRTKAASRKAGRKPKDLDVKSMRRMRKQGMTDEEIGKVYGVGATTVWRRLKKHTDQEADEPL